jgi:uncharacterized RDD family membrane protein YckC
MMSERPTGPLTSLRRALIANACFSSFCALVFLAFPGVVAGFAGAATVEIVTIGVNLVLFVGLISVVLTRREPLGRWVLGLAVVIAGLDVLWVLTTPLAIARYTVEGRWLFGVIALVVAVFAALQIRALTGLFQTSRQRQTLGV